MRNYRKYLYILGILSAFVFGFLICHAINSFLKAFNHDEVAHPGNVIFKENVLSKNQDVLENAAVTYQGYTDVKPFRILEKLGYSCSFERHSRYDIDDKNIIWAKKGNITMKFTDSKCFVNDKLVSKGSGLSGHGATLGSSWEDFTLSVFDFSAILVKVEPQIAMIQKYNDVYVYTKGNQ